MKVILIIGNIFIVEMLLKVDNCENYWHWNCYKAPCCKDLEKKLPYYNLHILKSWTYIHRIQMDGNHRTWFQISSADSICTKFILLLLHMYSLNGGPKYNNLIYTTDDFKVYIYREVRITSLDDSTCSTARKIFLSWWTEILVSCK